MRYIILLLITAALLLRCSEDRSKDQTAEYSKLSGQTMGTTYELTFLDTNDHIRGTAIDSLLGLINMAASTYIDSSVISRFNRTDERMAWQKQEGGLDPHTMFHYIYKRSSRIERTANGAFDPTVMPLVNYWGFGYKANRQVESIDSAVIDSLRGLVGMDKIRLEQSGDSILLIKDRQGVQLDFSSIAKGYGVDVLCAYLEDGGVRNYFVDIGGEIRVLGSGPNNPYWVAGVNVPAAGAAREDIFVKLKLTGQAVATSGNYRNFYTRDGVRYAHTINPRTGWPEQNDMLSATVVADDCTTADAWATAFMVMGSERAIATADTSGAIEVLFVINEDGRFKEHYSEGMKKLMIKDE